MAPQQLLDQIINDPLPSKVWPHDEKAEVAVLGAMLSEKNAVAAAVSLLQDGRRFYKTQHQHIFDASMYLFERDEAVDILTVGRRLQELNQLDECGGHYYLTELVARTPSAANIEYHCGIVKKLAEKRKLIGVSYSMLSAGLDDGQDVISILQTYLPDLFDLQANKKVEWKSLAEYAHLALERLEKAKATKQELLGIPTGFTEVDDITGGMQRSEFIVTGGRPGMGKTAYMMSCAQNAAANGFFPTVFSLEMAAIALALRTLSGKARINSHAFRALKYLSFENLKTLAGALMNNLDAWGRIFINDTSRLTPMDMMAMLKKLIAGKPEIADKLVVFVDYTQIISGGKNFASRNDEVSFISSFLKVIAKTFDCPVNAFSQLSRAVEQRGGDHRPMLSDLRDSGGIEQDADVVQFIYRDDYYDASIQQSIAEIIIAKQRNGPLGTARLYFGKEFTEFRNLQTGHNGKASHHEYSNEREAEWAGGSPF